MQLYSIVYLGRYHLITWSDCSFPRMSVAAQVDPEGASFILLGIGSLGSN